MGRKRKFSNVALDSRVGDPNFYRKLKQTNRFSTMTQDQNNRRLCNVTPESDCDPNFHRKLQERNRYSRKIEEQRNRNLAESSSNLNNRTHSAIIEQEIEIIRMVPYMLESKLGAYALAKTDTNKPMYDKKLPLPMTTQKTVVIDLENDNTNNILTCTESPAFLKENGSEIQHANDSTPKRTEPEQVVKQFQSANSANGHLVYVRRKPETESPNKYVSRGNSSISSPPRKMGDQYKKTEENLQSKEPMPTCLPSGKPSVPSSLEKLPNNLQEIGSDSCALSMSIIPSENPKRTKIQHWEERYCQLQEFLEFLDQSNQEDYVQMLRSLSPEDLSSQAIGLEKRSIQLSLEEAKELQRVQQLDVLGHYAKNSKAPAT